MARDAGRVKEAVAQERGANMAAAMAVAAVMERGGRTGTAAGKGVTGIGVGQGPASN